MKNKKVFITQKAYNNVKTNPFANALIIENTAQFWKKHLKDNKTKIVYIYDLGFNKNHTIIPINNHINKTGINILREEKKQKIEFYDITTIYHPQPKGKVAECFGTNKPLFQNTQYIQTYDLCNCVILAHKYGAKKIKAFIIN